MSQAKRHFDTIRSLLCSHLQKLQAKRQLAGCRRRHGHAGEPTHGSWPLPLASAHPSTTLSCSLNAGLRAAARKIHPLDWKNPSAVPRGDPRHQLLPRSWAGRSTPGFCTSVGEREPACASARRRASASVTHDRGQHEQLCRCAVMPPSAARCQGSSAPAPSEGEPRSAAGGWHSSPIQHPQQRSPTSSDSLGATPLQLHFPFLRMPVQAGLKNNYLSWGHLSTSGSRAAAGGDRLAGSSDAEGKAGQGEAREHGRRGQSCCSPCTQHVHGAPQGTEPRSSSGLGG